MTRYVIDGEHLPCRCGKPMPRLPGESWNHWVSRGTCSPECREDGLRRGRPKVEVIHNWPDHSNGKWPAMPANAFADNIPEREPVFAKLRGGESLLWLATSSAGWIISE